MKEAKKNALMVVALLILGGSSVQAGEADITPEAAKVEAMQKVSFLSGEWAGEGWFAMGPGERHHFRGREKVEMRLGGTVMVIEGQHWSRTHDGELGPLVHHAMAVVSPAQDGGYDFRSWLLNRDGGAHSAHVEEGAFVWSMQTPRGEMRYTIRLDDEGRWHEIGEMAGKDAQWHQFFEMLLTKD